MLTGRFLNVSLLGREVLQGVAHVAVLKTACFNPFEVREVLQANAGPYGPVGRVSIPLKSGRCCKTSGLLNRQ